MADIKEIELAIEITKKLTEELKIELKALATQEYIGAYNLGIQVKELSLEALEEKLEREKGCDQCRYYMAKYDFCPICGRKL